MATTTPASRRTLLIQTAVTFVLIISLFAVLARNRHIVSSSINTLHAVNIWTVCALLALTAVTFCIAAATYWLLALKPLSYPVTILIEVAAAAINRILPAGIGGLGLHGAYLYRHKHTLTQATAVVSVNNLVGFAVHVLLLALAIAYKPSLLSGLSLNGIHLPLVWMLAGLVATAIVFVSFSRLRIPILHFGRNLLVSLRMTASGRLKLLAALFSSALLTLTYVTILYIAARAADIEIGYLQSMVVFSFGMLIGTATPTPGGLVGVEAGLFAGLSAYGASEGMAAAATLLFRLVTYWAPIVPGCIAFLIARKRHQV